MRKVKKRKCSLGRPRRRWQYDINKDIKVKGCSKRIGWNWQRISSNGG
jgi:hypothetical protein